MTNSGIRILLVDDFSASREPLAELLDHLGDLHVVGQASSVAEAKLLLASGSIPDVALIDLALPDGHGSMLIRYMRERNPTAVALVLTGSQSPHDHARAIAAGAVGILHKSAPVQTVIDTVRQAASGESLLSPADVVEALKVLDTENAQPLEQPACQPLTARECDLMSLLAQGLSDREIADQLYISVKTVRNQMVALMQKLGVDSRLQALIVGLRRGIVRID